MFMATLFITTKMSDNRGMAQQSCYMLRTLLSSKNEETTTDAWMKIANRKKQHSNATYCIAPFI